MINFLDIIYLNYEIHLLKKKKKPYEIQINKQSGTYINMENYCVFPEYHKCMLPPSHEWWVSLIKFMVRPAIYMRMQITHL